MPKKMDKGENFITVIVQEQPGINSHPNNSKQRKTEWIEEIWIVGPHLSIDVTPKS